VTCPACGGVVSGQERCPACGSMVAPAVDGALAPDPSTPTPPAPGKARPSRDLPGLRRREKERDWRDEVRERVKSRRTRRAEGELPLFSSKDPDAATGITPPAAPAPRTEGASRPARPGGLPRRVMAEPKAAAPPEAPAPVTRPVSSLLAPPDFEILEVGVSETRLTKTDVVAPEHPSWDEKPLRDSEDPGLPPEEVVVVANAPADLPLYPSEVGGLDPAPARGTAPQPETDDLDEWALPASPRGPGRPVERPAETGQRMRAAALDLAVLGLLAVLVFCSASRVAHVSLASLLPTWPWFVAWMALLALGYATYFTGTTGQTPGKMLTGLRVVDTAGAGLPPGYSRAFLRAAAGAVGGALILGMVPILFDPARRGLHDRLLRTRVIRG
jgi:uncharacterized RDD family membrane protein YckC